MMIKNGWIRDVDGDWYPLHRVKILRADTNSVGGDIDDYSFIVKECDNYHEAQEYLDEMMGMG